MKNLTNEVRKPNEKFQKLDVDIVITKKVNTLLFKRIVMVERQCSANAQYARRETIEIMGIPKSKSIRRYLCAIFSANLTAMVTKM